MLVLLRYPNKCILFLFIQVDEKLLAAFMMADTMSTSPAHVDAATIGQAAALQASEVVEVTVFFSILQLLHRLAVWKACV